MLHMQTVFATHDMAACTCVLPSVYTNKDLAANVAESAAVMPVYM